MPQSRILEIVTYPHPTLRHRSKPIQRVDQALRNIVAEMFELMYEANGVGLAANQVDLPFRLFVANLASNPDEADELVFINPVLSKPRGNEEKEEGCLSLPGLYGPVIRPAKVHVNAYNLAGEEIDQEISGMLSRVVQHETDHLDGVLFIDRLSPVTKSTLEGEIEQFVIDHDRRQGQASESDVQSRLAALEREYC